MNPVRILLALIAPFGFAFFFLQHPGAQEPSNPPNFFDVTTVTKAADQGDAKAQLNLGNMYLLGQGVPQDKVEAVKWYRKAADQGDPIGQSSLGNMYGSGTGVPQDKVEAVKWYRKAADQGDPIGQSSLGNMYDSGTGVPQDYAEAVKWYRKAADQGDPIGQCRLGLMYFQGRGVPQDFEQAYFWLNLSAADKSDWLAILYGVDGAEFRDSVAEKLSPQALSDVQKRAREWAPTKSTE